MPYIEILIKNQLQLVATSFILGLIFGAFYDIIRFTEMLCGFLSFDAGKDDVTEKISTEEDASGEVSAGEQPRRGFFHSRRILRHLARFFWDFGWTFVFGIVFLVYVYWANDGTFRWFIPASAAVGFFLWEKTAGVGLRAFSEKLARWMKTAARVLILTPLWRILSAAGWIGKKLAVLFIRLARAIFGHTVGAIFAGIRRRAAIRYTERIRLSLDDELKFEAEEENGREEHLS